MSLERTAVFEQLFNALKNSLAVAIQAANDAHQLATHEQSKPETQYDTVGLEASYLAHGQSQRVAEIEQSIKDWKALYNSELDDITEVRLGSIVQLEEYNDDTNPSSSRPANIKVFL